MAFPDSVEHWLKLLGIETLCQWDVLVFLYRHQSSLLSADQIGRLLGYANAGVVSALEDLDALGLLQRSRISEDVRLYRFTVPSNLGPAEAFNELIRLSEHRAGRMRVAKAFRSRNGKTRADTPSVGRSRGEPCLKAI